MLRNQLLKIEAGVRGLLALYKLLYARYPESEEIESIGRAFEEQTTRER